jgi:hypothetical protein
VGDLPFMGYIYLSWIPSNGIYQKDPKKVLRNHQIHDLALQIVQDFPRNGSIILNIWKNMFQTTNQFPCFSRISAHD